MIKVTLIEETWDAIYRRAFELASNAKNATVVSIKGDDPPTVEVATEPTPIVRPAAKEVNPPPPPPPKKEPTETPEKEVIDAFKAFLTEKGHPAAVELLDSFGVKRLSALPAEYHAAFIDTVNAGGR